MVDMYYIKLYLLTFLAFLGIDAVWLAKIAPDFYKSNIGHLMADKPNLVPAGIFYLLNIFGILIFAVLPALKDNSPKTALVYGALYGFFTYATYDLTNFATLKNWPAKVVYVDIIWGIFLTATVSVVSYYVGLKLR
ncbi:DUF2177 family protein [Patescibacteria group bacterium]